MVPQYNSHLTFWSVFVMLQHTATNLFGLQSSQELLSRLSPQLGDHVLGLLLLNYSV
jgi:hypothetical protein